MTRVREPVVAGTFYPGSADILVATVDGLLGAAAAGPSSFRPSSLRGIIVPHAGYQYSGPVAASAYGLLPELRPTPSVVVILGPSHFEPLRGLAAAPHDAWRTPLGEVSLGAEVRRAITAADAMSDEVPHRSEHSIEVQLPFLQRCLPGVSILPVAVGHGPPREAAEMLGAALPDDALLIVSTDLSHYRDAATARDLDARTAAAIVELDDEALGPADACGVDALRAGVVWARSHGRRVVQLDLRNSADTVGDPSRVVGYGAFAILGS